MVADPALAADGLLDRMRVAMRDRPGMPLDDPYYAPMEGMFKKPGTSEQLDYLPAPDLEIIADHLIRVCSEFEHLADAQIAYVWKRAGGTSRGKLTLGTCTKASGLVKHFSGVSWIVALAADNVNAMALTRRQVEALLHHELCHAGAKEDEEGNAAPVVIGHDWEGFVANVVRYGAWMGDLKVCQDAWRQLPLDGFATAEA